MEPPLGSPPCNGCTACCEKDAVFLHPELGDDPALYETFEATHPLTGKKALMLKRGEDGLSCGYLKKGVGCTIYNNRPAMCREFDCRGMYLDLLNKYSRKERRKIIWRGLLSKEIVAQGRRLLNRSQAA